MECGTTGGKWLFLCQRWLCLDAGDGRIERELHPTVEEKEGGGGERRWRVHVWTSDIRGAGTDANVTLQVSQCGTVVPLQPTLKDHSYSPLLKTTLTEAHKGQLLLLCRIYNFHCTLHIAPALSLSLETNTLKQFTNNLISGLFSRRQS